MKKQDVALLAPSGTKSASGGRPTLSELDIERILIRISLTLYLGEDDDLIDWFDSIPNGKRAHFVKTALRQGGMTTPKEKEEFDEFIDDDLFDDLLSAL